MKKIALVLLLIFAAAFVVSCGKTTTKEPAKEKDQGYSIIEPETEKKKKISLEYLAGIPDAKPEGDFFTVATAGFDLKNDSDSVSYSNALDERNKMVEEKFGTQLTELKCKDPETMLADLYTSYLSGVYYSDIMVIPVSSVADFAAKGMLMNVNSLPYADYAMEYFDAETMKEFKIGRKVYAVSGAFNKDIGSYECLFINRTILENCGMDVPYASVADGSWTWDKLYEIMTSVNAAQPGISGLGYTNESEFADMVFASSGAKYLTDTDDLPKASFDRDISSEPISLFGKLVKSGLCFSSESSGKELAGSDVLFFVSTVDKIRDFAESETSWCILPVPKVNASQTTYCSRVSGKHPVVTIPVNNSYVEDTSYILSALNAASYGWFDDVYYEKLIEKYIRDGDALNMLDYICGAKGGNVSFDLAKTMSYRNREIGEYTYGVIRDSGNFGGFDGRYSSAKEMLDSIFMLYSVSVY
ncbi:MAG: extracellular solute-binding protein [Clostridia bacterium]|nr:extracellular solute-binding protein [Clostridia bacterium]